MSSLIFLLALGMSGVPPAPSGAAQAAPRYANRPLSDALRDLQAGGLRIVFSTEIVTADMRVTAEPRSAKPRQVLDELLKPHRLKAKDGPAGVIQIVRDTSVTPTDSRRTRPADRDSRAHEAVPLPRAHGVYVERVTVNGSDRVLETSIGGSVVQMGARTLADLEDVLSGDPARALQALPTVAAADDFRSELSVRGSPYRQMGIVIDGVPARWLQHAVYGAGDSGSLGMMNSLVVDRASLATGAYPRRSGDWIGPELDLTMREGSRAGARYSAAVGGTSATLLGEGPISHGRGSWLAAIRQGYREWPTALQTETSGKPFGFSDAQAKLVYDIHPDQQVTVTFLGGRSRVDERGGGSPGDLAIAANAADVVSAGWQSTINASMIARQRISFITHRFANATQAGADAGRGADDELRYDGSLMGTIPGGIAEAGVQVQRVRAMRALGPDNAFDASSVVRSGYLNASWTLGSRLMCAPGVRVSSSAMIARPAVSRWIAGAFSAGRGVTLGASAGIVEAPLPLDERLAGGGGPPLAPERAALVDVSVEQRFRRSLRWKATLFQRGERDFLLEPTGGVLSRLEDQLTGTARGLELLLERSSTQVLSGWIAYAFGKASQTNPETGERFWADFDRRHGVSAAAVARLRDRTNITVSFKGGTGFPIPGYFEARDGGLFAGGGRNEVRLPSYARLDARASHTIHDAPRRITLFGEVLNLLNRRNVGVTEGAIAPGTGAATGFTRALFPRAPSAGILIEF